MIVKKALYSLIIQPLVLLFEFVFAMAYRIIDEPGICIVVLSLVMNFLVLPLYCRADELQAAEQKKEAELAPWVKRIRQAFHGDEQYMMIQTYYRENGYKPIYALKGSLPLLLEVPFFIAAYRYLSGLQLLKGCSWGPIADLGAPDGLLRFGAYSFHLLPLLMTGINILSGAVYTKGSPVKIKLQLYGMALVFLVLLYPSPSGLVLYWTLNNLFSLAKNIVYKLKHPRRALRIAGCFAGLLVLCLGFVLPLHSARRQLALILIAVLLTSPQILHLLKSRAKPLERTKSIGSPKVDSGLFWAGAVFIALFAGLLIPSAVVESSPSEFVNTIHYINPILWVFNALAIALGTFVLWLGIFYSLMNSRNRQIMSLAVWLCAVAFALNYMFFGTGLGTLSSKLSFETHPLYSSKEQIANVLVLLGWILAGTVLWRKKPGAVRSACVVMSLVTLFMAVSNCVSIQKGEKEMRRLAQAANESNPHITLSRTGKNVVILMMDRAIGSYVPYLFHERPELAEQFAGFTWYPNTISFGAHTIYGTPPLFGGYEYTPEEMNQRDTEWQRDKHNEALRVLPILFDEHGWDVTVCDPPYANYQETPDLSIYDDHPGIRKYITMGKYNPEIAQTAADLESVWNRNFFCYSLFKCAPVALQPTLYSNGLYNDVDAIDRRSHETYKNPYPKQYPPESPSVAMGYDDGYVKSYWVMHSLPAVTELADAPNGIFLMMTNNMTHDVMLLKEPEYEVTYYVDNREYDAAHMDRFTVGGRTMHVEESNQMTHYHVNMAAFIEIGRWLDWLRESGVYDNTRIIIVADHGRGIAQFDDLLLPDDKDGMGDIMWVNPLLMVKDFGSKSFSESDELMTHADVPVIALEGLIENPVNPATGKPISNSAKYEGDLHVLFSNEYNVRKSNGKTFLPGLWYSVSGNALDPQNWHRIEDPLK